MGLMGSILGAGAAASQVGQAVGGVAEVFVGNRAEREAAEAEQMLAALQQYGLEFQQPAQGRFDRFMNALNRLPRPLLVVGTLSLFVYAMAAPAGFALRMDGLALVPDPLWWLLGAIVSFYFGARELHYQRARAGAIAPRLAALATRETTQGGTTETLALAETPLLASAPRAASQKASVVKVNAADPRFNAAIEEWRALRA